MTLDKLALRHSVRSYSDTPLSQSDKSKIRAAITSINSHEAGLHFSLVTDSPEAFQGFRRSYGLFKGVRNYIVLSADVSAYEMMTQKVGYYAEMLVMKCVDMGLGTCFVAGTFSRKHVNVQLRAGWEIIALVAVGYKAEEKEGKVASMARKFIKRNSKAPLQFYKGNIPVEELESSLPLFLPALKAVSLAPSAVNKQPVNIKVISKNDSHSFSPHKEEFMEVEAEQRRFLLSPVYSVLNMPLNFDCDYLIEAYVDKESQLIDLGIAMWNFEQAFPGYWVWGNPAKFIPMK